MIAGVLTSAKQGDISPKMAYIIKLRFKIEGELNRNEYM
tara:strand:- start:322 stop:438 length:117 start_codon:yes stop_codon:yes gene_type:complete